MDWQLVRDRSFYGIDTTCDLYSGAAKEPLCEGLWILGSVHSVLSLRREHRHDHWIVPCYRNSIAILQLWRIFAAWIYNAVIYSVEA